MIGFGLWGLYGYEGVLTADLHYALDYIDTRKQ